MSARNEWSVCEPRTLELERPVEKLHVRIINGAVNVVGTDEDTARLEVGEIEGPPLTVTHIGGTVTVAYDDLPWKGLLRWLDRKGRRRSAAVSFAVPARTRVEVGVVGASAVVSGIEGRTDVRGVTGDTTLVGLTGAVRADTVSGGVDAQGLTGDLRFNSVSGDLTVLEACGSTVEADSVSGNLIVDIERDTDSKGEAKRADLALTTVSGAIALLRRPPAEDEGPYDDTPASPGEVL